MLILPAHGRLTAEDHKYGRSMKVYWLYKTRRTSWGPALKGPPVHTFIGGVRAQGTAEESVYDSSSTPTPQVQYPVDVRYGITGTYTHIGSAGYVRRESRKIPCIYHRLRRRWRRRRRLRGPLPTKDISFVDALAMPQHHRIPMHPDC